MRWAVWTWPERPPHSAFGRQRAARVVRRSRPRCRTTPAYGVSVTLDEMIAAAATGTADVAEGWGQGRATYGGLVAALLLARAQTVVGAPERRLRTANVVFVGPVEPGPALIDAEVLRAGSSATTVSGRVVQGDEVRATLIATFGVARETSVSVAADDPAPSIPAPAEVDPVPYIAGVMPEFLQHVELRFATGSPPFTGAAEAAFGGWMRFRAAPAQFGDCELVALADAWPPGVAPLFSGPAPMSTLSWTFDLLGDAPITPDPTAQWQCDVRTIAASGGYGQTTARIWDPQGELRALSRQTIAYFR